jgi:hypothetical protein
MPTPPVAPTLTPASSNTAPALPAAAHSGAPQNVSKPVNSEVPGIVKELEAIRKAFQGKPPQTKAGGKTEPAATATTKPNSIKAAPAPYAAQERDSAQTVVSPKPLVDNKPFSVSYLPFVGIVGIVAIILLGLRLLKKPTQQPSTPDYSHATMTATNKEGIDVAAPPQTMAPKAKSNFEARV